MAFSFYRKKISHLKTLFWRRPNEELKRLLRWGPQSYFLCNSWMREMEEAAHTLPQLPSSRSHLPIPLWFLTGKRFWYQTAFCAWTFAKQSGREVILNLVDDGSLTSEHESGLRRLFPQGVTIHKSDVQERIATLLPVERFPILRQRWDDYINIRKLIDIHLGSTGVKLVLDSDMLFFRKPQAILDWWDSAQSSGKDPSANYQLPTANYQLQPRPYTPLLMTDCEESYGYSRNLMEELARAPIPPLLNVGICGLRSESLDWEESEYWCRTLVEREGTSYYLEQALVAMLAARNAPTVMPRSEYITLPTERQVMKGEGELQHYVADSKPWYFGKAWKLAVQS